MLINDEQAKVLQDKPDAERTPEEVKQLADWQAAKDNAGNDDEPQDDKNPVPYQKFAALNAEKKEAEAKLKQMQADLKKLADAEAARQKAADEQQETQLAEQKKFEELATKRAIERDEAKAAAATTATELERHQKALAVYLEAARKDLPKHLLALLDKLDTVEQLEYLTTNKDALGIPGVDGIPPTNGAGNQQTKINQDEKKKRAATTARF